MRSTSSPSSGAPSPRSTCTSERPSEEKRSSRASTTVQRSGRRRTRGRRASREEVALVGGDPVDRRVARGTRDLADGERLDRAAHRLHVVLRRPPGVERERRHDPLGHGARRDHADVLRRLLRRVLRREPHVRVVGRTITASALTAVIASRICPTEGFIVCPPSITIEAP